MKPFTTIAIVVFALIAFMHILRLVLNWEVTVNAIIIPMWVSVLGLVSLLGSYGCSGAKTRAQYYKKSQWFPAKEEALRGEYLTPSHASVPARPPC